MKRRIFSVQQNNHTVMVMATFIYELCSIIYPKMLFFGENRKKNRFMSTRM